MSMLVQVDPLDCVTLLRKDLLGGLAASPDIEIIFGVTRFAPCA